MIGPSVYRAGVDFAEQDAERAWQFLMGYIEDHARRCLKPSCDLCESVKQTVCCVAAQRYVKAGKK